jgi:hypothetical protein
MDLQGTTDFQRSQQRLLSSPYGVPVKETLFANAMRRVSQVGLVLAILSSAHAATPATPIPSLPAHPWGVYAWGGARGGTLPADMPIRGIPISWRWPELEPARGKFNFEEAVRHPLEQIRDQGLYTHIMLWVAPVTPEWVYEAGVPKVIMPERITPARKRQKPTYPYYFSPLYKDILQHTVRALADYIAALPADLKNRIIFTQVAEGSTGDGQPYKGVPVDPHYHITDEAWNNYRRETWAFYQSLFQRADGSLNVPLLVNGDANTPIENDWLLEHCATFGVKQGMFSHGYLVSETVARLARWEKFRAEALMRGHTIFSRGEQDEEWQVCGWSKQNPPRAFYWSAFFALHCKLDVWNVPMDALATQPIDEAVRVFNRYAGWNEPAGSPVAFCALRRGLDAADTAAFPAEKFGAAEKSNRDRYVAIAAAYAPLGARQGDPDKALGGGMRNRQADDQNDVGWGILAGNFERHLTQLRPEETSIGLWNVGPPKHPYGLFARRFDVASGRRTMSFRIADGFFASPANSERARLRVVYLDAGQGRWDLVYSSAKGEKMARSIELTGSGEWREINETLADAVWDHRLAGGGDLALRHAGGVDTVFHLLELERRK